MKRAIPNNDKKKKKEMTTQIEKLESDMKIKHDAEISELTSKVGTIKVEDSSINAEEAWKAKEKAMKEKIIAKNTKKQEKKAADQKRKAELEAQDEANAATSRGNLETESIVEELNKRKLEAYNIAPDGDCLFNAVAHQLSLTDKFDLNGSNIRAQTADYLRKNADEFMPFMTDEQGEMLTEEGFKKYCKGIEESLWGGSPELNAISKIFKKKIIVIQSNQQPTVFGEEFDGKPIIITYHRYAYELGEHYNSTISVE